MKQQKLKTCNNYVMKINSIKSACSFTLAVECCVSVTF